MSDWNEAIERAKHKIGLSGEDVKLRFGELSAQEMRTAKSILSWAINTLDSLKRPADQDGWKLVPVEPTIEMHAGDAATLAEEVLMKGFWGDWEMPGPPTGSAIATAIYKAMLASAPTPEAK